MYGDLPELPISAVGSYFSSSPCGLHQPVQLAICMAVEPTEIKEHLIICGDTWDMDMSRVVIG